MFGWTFILDKENKNINDEVKYNFIYNNDNVKCGYIPNNKFENDKVYLENNRYIIIIDGVIFNNNELVEEYKQENWQDTVVYMYEKLGDTFYNKFRGSFNGMIYCKRTEKFIAFTNHIGDRAVFYYLQDKKVIVSSNMNFLSKLLLENNIKVTLDDNYVKYMLTFGFMLDNSTFYKEVKRLMPGEYYLYSKEISINSYFKFNNYDDINITEEEAIKLIDKTFVNALKLEINKDKEYGYKSILDISGGLDSRAVNYACKKLRYNNLINLSYSQMDSNEYKVTKEIVKDLNNDYIYKSLDNPSFIYEVDDLVEKNYGLTIFSGITGGKQLLESINMDNIGIEHTGLLGDVNDGSFSDDSFHTQPYFQDKYRFSKVLSNDILDKGVLKKYENHEMFCFYTRGILGGLGTHLIRQNYTETFSPFEDVDFLNLTFKLPLKMRVDNHIFRKWLIQCYPEATKIVYDHTMCKITDSDREQLLKMKVRAAVKKIKKLLGVLSESTVALESMNPFEYWYNNNKNIKSFINDYYEENKNRLNNYSELNKLIVQVYEEGNVIDKMAVLTVLAVIKRYFR